MHKYMWACVSMNVEVDKAEAEDTDGWRNDDDIDGTSLSRSVVHTCFALNKEFQKKKKKNYRLTRPYDDGRHVSKGKVEDAKRWSINR